MNQVKFEKAVFHKKIKIVIFKSISNKLYNPKNCFVAKNTIIVFIETHRLNS